MTRILILDCEIENAILNPNDSPMPGVKYAEGWKDYKGMGIACIGAYERWTGKHRVFTCPHPDFHPGPFADLLNSVEWVITFNGTGFDFPLIEANWRTLPWIKETHIDLLVELRDKQGFDKYTKGFSLNNVAKANGIPGKSGDGAKAPILWQQGRYCEVIDYCLNDVWVTNQILTRCIEGNYICPIRGKKVQVKLPFIVSGAYQSTV